MLPAPVGLPQGHNTVANRAPDNPRVNEWHGMLPAADPRSYLNDVRNGEAAAAAAGAPRPPTMFETTFGAAGLPTWLPFHKGFQSGDPVKTQFEAAGWLACLPVPQAMLPLKRLMRGTADEATHVRALVDASAPMMPALQAHLRAVAPPPGRTAEEMALLIQYGTVEPRSQGRLMENVWRDVLMPEVAMRSACSIAAEAMRVQLEHVAMPHAARAAAIAIAVRGVEHAPVAAAAPLSVGAAASAQAEASARAAHAQALVAALVNPAPLLPMQLPPASYPHVRPGQRHRPPAGTTNRDAHVLPWLRPLAAGMPNDPEEAKKTSMCLGWVAGVGNNEGFLAWRGRAYFSNDEKLLVDAAQLSVVHITFEIVELGRFYQVALPAEWLVDRFVWSKEHKMWMVDIRSRLLRDANGTTFGNGVITPGNRLPDPGPLKPRVTRELWMQCVSRLVYEFGWVFVQEIAFA